MFSEFSFSRVSESTSLFSFSLGGIFISPSIDTIQKGKTAVSDFSKKTPAKWDQQNCQSFEASAGGIKPPSDSWLIERHAKIPSLNDISTSSKTKLRIKAAKYDFEKHTDFLRGKAT